MLKQIFLITAISLGFFTASKATLVSTKVEFYSQSLEVKYDASIISQENIRLEESSLLAYYKSLEKKPYQTFLREITRHKERYLLNDYLTYLLVHRSVQKIWKGKSEHQKTLATWFFLSKMGYDTYLTFTKRYIAVNVKTNDSLFNIPIIKESNKSYVNLTALHNKGLQKVKTLRVLTFRPNPNGKSFGFAIKKLPKLATNPIDKKLVFKHKGESITLDYQIDETLIKIMTGYPSFDEMEYINVPLSSLAIASLTNSFAPLLKGKNEEEKVELLVDFTRHAFGYKEDDKNFGYNKPMIAEEALFYSHSDCEDRVAILYHLSKAFLKKPVVVVSYHDHLSLAIQLSQNKGKPIRYRGEKYTLCDPTGPTGSHEIGIYPRGYDRKRYDIIGQ